GWNAVRDERGDERRAALGDRPQFHRSWKQGAVQKLRCAQQPRPVGYRRNTKGGPAVIVDAGLTGGDPDSANLGGATVSISAGFLSGDKLNFGNQNGISGSYNAATGVLTLTDSASLANYQTALESVTFSSSSADPTNGGANLSRTISWVA